MALLPEGDGLLWAVWTRAERDISTALERSSREGARSLEEEEAKKEREKESTYCTRAWSL